MSERDEKFEEFLLREASRYNEPGGDVPRDEMWAAIRAERSKSGVAPQRRGEVIPWIRRAAAPIARRGAWLGMAATLLLGLAVGRFALRPARGAKDLAVGPVDSATRAGGPEVAPARGGTLLTVLRPDVRSGARQPGEDAAGIGYQLAAAAHLARAEALLTAFGASPADPARDVPLTRWAQDVLANTRLLMDSPAGRDPERRRLMEDLELVLVQLVQRPGGARATEDRLHIERSLERTQVLPRLRSTQTQAPNSGT